VRAEPFSTLIVEFADQVGARAIVKGLRAISDFEYEFEMHQLNRREAPHIDTLYLMASPQYSFLSSSGVKELGHVRRPHRGPGPRRGRRATEGRARAPANL
jgi:pantetheine-phosphate adenylyltransferase